MFIICFVERSVLFCETTYTGSDKMKTLINKVGFIKAVEHVSTHFFSTPFSLTPIVDRWFNQLAMLQFEGEPEPVSLTGQVALHHVDIVLDGKVVDIKDIALITQFHSKNSNHEKVREELQKKLDDAVKRLVEEETKVETPNFAAYQNNNTDKNIQIVKLKVSKRKTEPTSN